MGGGGGGGSGGLGTRVERFIYPSELIAEAERLFPSNKALLDSLRASQGGSPVGNMIKSGRQSLSEVPGLSAEGAVQFLSRQLDIERLYTDWLEFSLRALLHR